MTNIAALLTYLLLAIPDPAAACSKRHIGSYRHAENVYFLGRALPDTVFAGEGAVQFATGAGHSGYGRRRQVYGQVVAIQRIGAPWKSALPADAREIVLVPWDYAADCSPIIWGGSAQWIPGGTEGLYRGLLRAPEHWVNGLPTLDVHTPEFVPYPAAPGLRRRANWLPDPDRTAFFALSAEAFLGLMEVLPTPDSMNVAPMEAIQPLEDWAAAHPAESQQVIARDIMRELRRTAEDRIVLTQPSAVAGTYRFVVTGDQDSIVFFARTAEYPTGTLRAIRRDDLRESDHSIVGHYLTTRWAATLPQLPDQVAVGAGEYYAVGIVPVVSGGDSTVWRGNTYVEPIARSLVRSEAMQGAVAALNVRDPEFHFVPGLWVLFSDGRVRFERRVERDGRVVVTVRGDRISRETVHRRRR